MNEKKEKKLLKEYNDFINFFSITPNTNYEKDIYNQKKFLKQFFKRQVNKIFINEFFVEENFQLYFMLIEIKKILLKKYSFLKDEKFEINLCNRPFILKYKLTENKSINVLTDFLVFEKMKKDLLKKRKEMPFIIDNKYILYKHNNFNFNLPVDWFTKAKKHPKKIISVFEYFLDNPNATVAEVSENIKISYNVAFYICKTVKRFFNENADLINRYKENR